MTKRRMVRIPSNPASVLALEQAGYPLRLFKPRAIYEPVTLALGLSVIRGRYDTRRQTHQVDDEVWVVARAELAILFEVPEPPVKGYKLQPFLMTNEFDLSLIEPETLTIEKRAYRPLAPLNFTANGGGRNPTYGTGEDVELAWSVSGNRPPDVPVTAVLEPEIDRTVVEVLTTADELKGTFAFDGGTSPRTLTNAQIVKVKVSK